jgi:hypothetical protein
MGDFNTHSHLDGATGPDAQVSRAMEKKGFVDSYFSLHPTPSQRIDFIYANKYLKPIRSVAVVEGVFGSRGDLDSDHPAVYSEFVFTSGCTDAKARNYDAFAVVDDGTCSSTSVPHGRRITAARGAFHREASKDALGRRALPGKRPVPGIDFR